MVGILSFLAVVSVIVFVVALIILSIRLIKKKSWKPFVIMACASAVIFFSLCIGISNIYVPVEKPDPVVTESDGHKQPVTEDEPSESPEETVAESEQIKHTNNSTEEATQPSDVPSMLDENTKQDTKTSQNTESETKENPVQDMEPKTDENTKQPTESETDENPEQNQKSKTGKTTKPKQKIRQSLKDIVEENYASTEVSDITINENLGTDDSGDYIALVTLTWNVKNKPDLTKKMLAMYSEDYAARIGSDIPKVSELCIFWIVPYYSDSDTVAKYAYERRKKGMYETDSIISELLNE